MTELLRTAPAFVAMAQTLVVITAGIDLSEREKEILRELATGKSYQAIGKSIHLSEDGVRYHIRKAAGGCALVMTFGSASVDPATAASYGAISLWDERGGEVAGGVSYGDAS
jgi:DNA-binding CsgD family transcriptional regulator